MRLATAGLDESVALLAELAEDVDHGGAAKALLAVAAPTASSAPILDHPTSRRLTGGGDVPPPPMGHSIAGC